MMVQKYILKRQQQWRMSVNPEQGSALIVALVMLLLMTIIGLAGMQTTILQERMTANYHDRELAFQAAEAALREAENLLLKNAPASFPNSNGLYEINHASRPDWPNNPTDTGGGVLTFEGDIAGVSQSPTYFIEQIDSIVPAGTELEAGRPVPAVAYFRITALGYGGSPDTTVVLTSVYQNR